LQFEIYNFQFAIFPAASAGADPHRKNIEKCKLQIAIWAAPGVRNVRAIRFLKHVPFLILARQATAPAGAVSFSRWRKPPERARNAQPRRGDIGLAIIRAAES
jgi:hypothetical protein